MNSHILMENSKWPWMGDINLVFLIFFQAIMT